MFQSLVPLANRLLEKGQLATHISNIAKKLEGNNPEWDQFNLHNAASAETIHVSNTPRADAQAGTLALWALGDVVMFYGSFGSAAGLYELGHAVSGSEHIQKMPGTIKVEYDSSP